MIKDMGVKIKDSKIYDDSLGLITEKDNPLSELVEIAKVEYIGEENDILIYICYESPKEVTSLMVGNYEEGDHVYVGISKDDLKQEGFLGPY